MLSLRLFILLLLFTAEPFVAQRTDHAAYGEIRKQYSSKQINDTAAIPYIRLLISLAKKEKNYVELTHAYHDALNFQPSPALKLQYADSAITAAHRSCRNDLIASAYMGRGIVNYFNFKNYRKALDSYIAAEPYVKESGDPYMWHKFLYHLGVVKSYVDDYDQAICHFTECTNFFQQELLKKPVSNALHNMRKGYFNSLHQLINCYQQIGDDETADCLTALGESELPDESEFRQVRSYFAKTRGISEYRKANYEAGNAQLISALPELIKVNDFAWVSVIYFYLGKTALAQRRQQEAFVYFKKVDSVYRQHRFIFPELQENYRILVAEAHKNLKMEELVTYEDLLRECVLLNNDDRHHLYARFEMARADVERRGIARRYDTFTGVLTASLCILLIVLSAYLETYGVKARVPEPVEGWGSTRDLKAGSAAGHQKPVLSPEIRERIRTNLQKFEDEKRFLKPDLKLAKVAQEVGVNANYLSLYLNTEKGMRFDRYLSEQRIFYMAAQLAEDPKMLEKGVGELAAFCGMKSSSNFRHLFYAVYGMPLWEYRKQCREKLGIF